RAEPTGLFYICNPTNPTGTVTPRAQIEALIAGKPRGRGAAARSWGRLALLVKSRVGASSWTAGVRGKRDRRVAHHHGEGAVAGAVGGRAWQGGLGGPRAGPRRELASRRKLGVTQQFEPDRVPGGELVGVALELEDDTAALVRPQPVDTARDQRLPALRIDVPQPADELPEGTVRADPCGQRGGAHEQEARAWRRVDGGAGQVGGGELRADPIPVDRIRLHRQRGISSRRRHGLGR